MNAGEIQEYLIKHQVGPVTASEVAVCLQLQDLVREDAFKEIHKLLESRLNVDSLHTVIEAKLHPVPPSHKMLSVPFSVWDLTCLEYGKLPEEV